VSRRRQAFIAAVSSAGVAVGCRPEPHRNGVGSTGVDAVHRRGQPL